MHKDDRCSGYLALAASLFVVCSQREVCSWFRAKHLRDCFIAESSLVSAKLQTQPAMQHLELHDQHHNT